MAKLLRLVIAISFAGTIHFTAASQSLSVNTTGLPAVNSSILDVSSTDKGVLIPRMSKAQKNAIAAPATGLLIYQSTPDSTGFYYFDGTMWAWLQNSAGADTIAWKTTGNTGLNDTSFIGHRDNKPINFRVNNIKAGRFDNIRVNYFIGRNAGHNNGVGHVSIGDSSGAIVNNNYPGVHIGYRSAVRSTGLNNTFIGSWSGELSTAGSANVFVGTLTGRYNTTGYANTYLGYASGQDNRTGAANTLLGYAAGITDTSGIGNVAVGYEAMRDNRAGGYNTAVGIFSMWNHNRPFPSYNTAVGSYAMEQDTIGYYNTAIGTSALRSNLSGFGNTAIGVNTMYYHRNNNYNTAVGFESMQEDTSGDINTAMGWRSLKYNRAGQANTAIGVGALEFTDSSVRNTALGRGAMIGVLGTKGTADNVAVGFYAGAVGDSVLKTVYVGTQAGYWNERNEITAVGTYAGHNNSRGSTNLLQGIENTMIGYSAMTGNALGSQNTVVGYKAMSIFEPLGSFSATAPSRNVAIGDSALKANRSNDNVAVGYRALSSVDNINMNGHVAIGSRALIKTTSTYPNTAIGYSSMDSTTTGGANTAVGSYSLSENKTGINNTAVGNAAMYQIETGSDNTAVGNDAMRIDSGSNNTGVGSGVLRYNKRSNNTALGYFAGWGNNFAGVVPEHGTENTAIGYRSLQANGSGRKNTGVGFRALSMYLDGNVFYSVSSTSDLSRNTAVGDSSQSYSLGQGNTTIGNASLSINYIGSYNTAMGDSAMGNTLFTNENEAYGHKALKKLKNLNGGGYWNTAIGGQAMENDSSAYATVAVGFRALRNSGKTEESTAIGVGAMENGDSTVWSTAVGRGALFNFGRSEQNTAVGTWSMSNKKSGIWNTAVGLFAMEQDTSGNSNTGIGTSAFRSNLRSSNNTGLGLNAGYYQLGTLTTGNNTYVGAYSGAGILGLSTATNNTGVGYQSLQGITTGNQNVALGVNAGAFISTASNNTMIGYEADASGNFTNASAIGSRAYVGQSNSIVLGSINGTNGATANTAVGIGTTTPLAPLHVANITATTDANAGYFESNNSTTAVSNGAAILAINTYAGTNDVAGIVSRVENTTPGNGYGGYFSGGQYGVYARSFNAAAGTASNFTIGVWGDADALTTSTNYGVYGSASGGATNYAIYCAGNGGYTGTWAAISDKMFKKDIKPIDGTALGLLKQLNPVSYLLKANEYKSLNFPTDTQYGFVAQELEKVFPLLVEEGAHPGENKNDPEMKFKTVNYIGLIPVLTKSIQEQQIQIENQARENEALKKKNEALEKDILLIKEKLGIKN